MFKKTYAQRFNRLLYFPGGKVGYVESLRSTLTFVDSTNPIEVQLTNWIRENFNVHSENLLVDLIQTMERLELITKQEDRFLLTESARVLLKTTDNRIVFSALCEKYSGINEIMELLQEAISYEQIVRLLCEKGIQWNGKHQYLIRLNWLQSIGYVHKTGQLYVLTQEGWKIFGIEKALFEAEENVSFHQELKNDLKAIGACLDWETLFEFPVGRYRIDAVYRQKGIVGPICACEIQICANHLEEALSRLYVARNQNIFELRLYTTEDQIAQAKEIARHSFPDLIGDLKIIDIMQIKEDRIIAERFQGYVNRSFSRRLRLRYRRFRRD